MARFPRGTPYQGPHVNYDAQMDTSALVNRIVYGKPSPLLGNYRRMDMEFFGRLFDELANSHAVLIQVVNSRAYGYLVAAKLRQEIGTELYEIGVKQDPSYPREDEWFVVAYNKITRTMVEPGWRATSARPGAPMELAAPDVEWVTMREVAYVLRLTKAMARRVVHDAGIEVTRSGARNAMAIRRSDLVRLANRPGRWKRRRRTRGGTP